MLYYPQKYLAEDFFIMNKFEFLKNTLGLTDQRILDDTMELCESYNVNKGEKLIRVGEHPDNIFLLVEGIFRGYFEDIAGKEITDCLVAHPGYPLMHSSNLDEEAAITIEALTNSTVLRFPISKYYHLMKKYPEIEMMHRKMVLLSSSYHRQLKVMMYQYDASQRYCWFVKYYPGILDEVNHKHIASFLNMTPVTLSRLINKRVPIEPERELIDMFSFPEIEKL